jgi:hypothetical protein
MAGNRSTHWPAGVFILILSLDRWGMAGIPFTAVCSVVRNVGRSGLVP